MPSSKKLRTRLSGPSACCWRPLIAAAQTAPPPPRWRLLQRQIPCCYQNMATPSEHGAREVASRAEADSLLLPEHGIPIRTWCSCVRFIRSQQFTTAREACAHPNHTKACLLCEHLLLLSMADQYGGHALLYLQSTPRVDFVSFRGCLLISTCHSWRSSAKPYPSTATPSTSPTYWGASERAQVAVGAASTL